MMVTVSDTILNDLTRFASEQQRRFDSTTLPSERRERGHYGTPAAIADFMGAMFSNIPGGTVRILDPGAGVGILAAAVCQRVLREKLGRLLEIELWENDPKLITHLRKTMDYCRKTLAVFGHRLDYTICIDDFILANARPALFKDGPKPSFHLAILNPPYFKLRKESNGTRSSWSTEHLRVIHGHCYRFASACGRTGRDHTAKLFQRVLFQEISQVVLRSYDGPPYSYVRITNRSVPR